jgi:hypothetical protein
MYLCFPLFRGLLTLEQKDILNLASKFKDTHKSGSDLNWCISKNIVTCTLRVNRQQCKCLFTTVAGQPTWLNNRRYFLWGQFRVSYQLVSDGKGCHKGQFQLRVSYVRVPSSSEESADGQWEPVGSAGGPGPWRNSAGVVTQMWESVVIVRDSVVCN